MLDMGFEPQMREIVSRIRVSPNVMRFMYCGLVCMYVALCIIVNFIDREIDKQLCGVLPGQWQCTVSYVIPEIVNFDFTCIHVAIALPGSKDIYIYACIVEPVYYGHLGPNRKCTDYQGVLFLHDKAPFETSA